MSYVRFGSEGSDVYVFRNTDERYECCGCLLYPGECYSCETPQEMIDHLNEHTAAGHWVPAFALQSLQSEVTV